MLLLILDVFGLALWPTFSFSQHFSFWQFARATGRSTVLIAGDAVFNPRRRSRQECESRDRTRNVTKTVCIQRNFSKFRRVSVPLPSTHALSVSGRRSLACVGSGSHAHRLMFCAAVPTTELPADARDESHPPRCVIQFHCTPCCIIIIHPTRCATSLGGCPVVVVLRTALCFTLARPPLRPVHTSAMGQHGSPVILGSAVTVCIHVALCSSLPRRSACAVLLGAAVPVTLSLWDQCCGVTFRRVGYLSEQNDTGIQRHEH